jgi:superfamily II DNA or RNA helicase
LRERVFRRSGGRCERCGQPITLDTWDVSHLRAHVHGGPAIEENLQAWCIPCNRSLGATDVGDSRVTPRPWQAEALEPIVRRIVESGVATVSAAPGAGKTVFAGLVFERLCALGVVERMVVLAPRRTLIKQWVAALARQRHLELKPFATCERRHAQQRGVVVTYQSLNLETTAEHREQAARARTLLVLDEVHHVGMPEGRGYDLPAWARRVAELGGTVDKDLHVAGVLNLSGTLWRSNVNERIATVRYRTLENGRLESIVDYEVDVAQLIFERELRPVDLFRQGAHVEVADLRRLEIIDSHIADLDERVGQAVVTRLGTDDAFRAAFVGAVLERLEVAHRSLGGVAAKALIVAHRQSDARAMQETADALMRKRGLVPITALAISDEDDAAETLERFRRQRHVGVLCTVDMAGEGYDCPEIVVIGYASGKRTPLYIRQVVARAQRVTERERRQGRPIPATVVVPDIQILVERVSSVVLPMHHEVVPHDRPPRDLTADGREAHDSGAPDVEWQEEFQEYHLRHVLPDLDMTARVVGEEDSDVSGAEVKRWEPFLERVGIEPTYATRFLFVTRQVAANRREAQPFDTLTPNDAAVEAVAEASRPTTREDEVAAARRRATVEDEAASWQRDLHSLSKWWATKGDRDVPVSHFTAEVNAAAGIPPGGRASASVAQLRDAYDIAAKRITAYATHRGIRPPVFRRRD